MAWIPGVERGGPLVRVAYAVARRRFGAVPEPLTLWAHSPGVLRATVRYESAASRWTAVDPATRSLVVLRAAQVMECPWCLDFGAFLSRDEGVSEEQLRELSRWREAGCFSPAQQVALEYTEAATATPIGVTEEHVARLRQHYDERAVVELAMLVALENLRARFNGGLGIPPQGFSADACVVPPVR